ncbi:MAG: branched-chain amino acid ABC transporter ATP-binding protein [Chloroflexi bacterium RBG_16_50_11]|nr:MAG: branched-chain amino acid ABC transporter ATP-binding protein [Chloroflexi bacterium RBG_16_50_11]
MLEIDKLNAGYGSIQVLWDVSLKVNKGEIVALIGANGAGKSTLINTITGLLRATSGSIKFLDKAIDRLPSHVIAELGISHIPEGRKLFTEMSVRENLEMGAYPKSAWKSRKETLERVYGMFPRLKERERQLARTFSGGEQQMLAMGRGLMSQPKLCIIDEPSNGLAPMVVMEVFQIIQSLREQGITILLIEQNVRQTLEISDRAYVLENGRIVMEGDCATCLASEHIKKAYLGL